MSKPDLLEIIRALASGSPVDWSALDAPADQSTHALLQELAIVSRVAEAHGTLDSSSSIAPTEPEPSAPRSWGPLTLLERVGKGRYGEVYRAWDTRLDREVALKLLEPDAGASSVQGTIIEEGRLLARVRHQNVVSVYGADRIDGRVGIWTEFVDGQTLEQRLQHQVFSAEEASTVGIAVCRGLAAVHRAGLVHGDIKSTNVMREDGGRVVLMDFGASEQQHGMRQPRIAGTPAYMAPEVLKGAPTSVASDVYAVGVLLHHLLTGGYPVEGSTLAELRDCHQQQRRRSLANAAPNVASPLVAVIEQALAVDPARRFDSADAMAKALAEVLQPIVASGGVKVSSRRGWVVAAAMLLAIGIGAAPIVYHQVQRGAQAALKFSPRDYVLIAKFDNRTGEPVFDGAVEYALQRALSESTVLGLVPDERVADALALMKRPRDTVVDRQVGRQVALRDGHIKALLTGRVERFGANYVITAQLIDPSNDAVVATIAENARGQDRVLDALQRQSIRVRTELGEKLSAIRGADPNVEAASTSSLQAFQLYNQSYRLGRDGNWPAALEIAKQVVKEDPDFASGWIWLAWSVHNAAGINEYDPNDPRISTFRDYADRAVQLADRVPEWERHWIIGSYDTLTGQLAEAIPHYQALLRLRPDHFFALNNLMVSVLTLHRPQDYPVYLSIAQQIGIQRPGQPGFLVEAVVSAVRETGRSESASPFIDQLTAISKSDSPSAGLAKFYGDFSRAYVLWYSGNLPGALREVNAIAAALNSYPANLRVETVLGVADFYESMGRARDRKRFEMSVDTAAHHEQYYQRENLDTRDFARIRRLLGTAAHPPSRYVFGPAYVNAGMLDEARLYAAGKSPNYHEGAAAITRGMLALLANRPQEASQELTRGVQLEFIANHPDYWQGCERLADALWQLNKQQDAVASLEECSHNRFKLTGVWAPMGAARASLDLHLARLYRLTGDLRAADAIKARVRTSLTLADADYPLLTELR